MNSMIFALHLWAKGTQMDVLAAMAGANHDEFEGKLQDCLRDLCEQSRALGFAPGEEDSRPQPPTTAETPQQGAATVRAADSSPLPEPNHAAAMKRSPARKAVAKAMNGAVPLSKADLITDWLRQEPLTCADIADKARAAMVETSDHEKWASDGLWFMRTKGLVIKPDVPGGKWRLA